MKGKSTTEHLLEVVPIEESSYIQNSEQINSTRHRCTPFLRVFEQNNSHQETWSLMFQVTPSTEFQSSLQTEILQLSVSSTLYFPCLTWFTVFEDCGITIHGIILTRIKYCYRVEGKWALGFNPLPLHSQSLNTSNATSLRLQQYP